MKKIFVLLAMLRYQADRYQSMRNGTMSQRVNAEIRRLLEEMGANAKNSNQKKYIIFDVFSSPGSFIRLVRDREMGIRR